MVSKLIFKGDKKKSKKKKSHILKNASEELIQKKHPIFFINGKETKLEDIDLKQITNGWTTINTCDLQVANHSLIDSESGKLPVIIAFSDTTRNVCLAESKYTSTSSDSNVRSKLKFSDDLELCDPDSVIVYTDREISIDEPISRIEPKVVDEVFILSDVSSIFKSSNKFLNSSNGEKIYSIKTTDGDYLTFDPTTNELQLLKTLTENGIFSLTFEITNSIPYCRIEVGNREEHNTLIITKSSEVKIIPDPDDLLQAMSRFIVKIRKEDALQTKQILKAAKTMINDTENNRGFEEKNQVDPKVRKTILELSKSGIKINDKTVKEITKAHADGKINQWIVDFKEKNISDRRT